MKIRFTLTLLLLVLWTSLSIAQQTKYVNSQTLNLRENPSTTAAILAKLSKGESVSILKSDEHWCFIETSNGIKGYVSSVYLTDNRVTQVSKQVETTVLICGSKSAYAYHSHYCHGLNRCKSGISRVSVGTATNRGYRACKICYK